LHRNVQLSAQNTLRAKELIAVSAKKTGFVFYFDSYAIIASLPPDQRGHLLSFLCVYGDRLWREPDTDMEETLEQFPALTEEAKVCCRFLGQALQRDTRRWLDTIAARQRKKQEHTDDPLARRRQDFLDGKGIY